MLTVKPDLKIIFAIMVNIMSVIIIIILTTMPENRLTFIIEISLV